MQLEPRLGLQRDAEVAARQAREVGDPDEGADRVEVGLAGVGDGRVLLGGDADEVALLQVAGERDRSLAADGERDDRPGEEHPVTEGQEGEGRDGHGAELLGGWEGSNGHGHEAAVRLMNES